MRGSVARAARGAARRGYDVDVYSPLPHPSTRWSFATAAFVVVAGPILALVMILGLIAWFFHFLGSPDLSPPPRPAQHAK
jgi:hypothetical protein